MGKFGFGFEEVMTEGDRSGLGWVGLGCWWLAGGGWRRKGLIMDSIYLALAQVGRSVVGT